MQSECPSSRDDVVSSSSQEPVRRSLAVQTSPQLLQKALEELVPGGDAPVPLKLLIDQVSKAGSCIVH